MSGFSVASVFSSSMVLQREKPIAVFGTGIMGSTITVTIKVGEKEASASTVVDSEKWIVYLPAFSAAEDCTMVVTDGESSKSFTDIAIGEVWLCGGQSNMEFELQNCSTAVEHLKNDNPNVRFYYTQKKSILDEDFFESEACMVWKRFDSESAKCWSAVGYLFGRRLSEALNVTVGLIGCNWGGTSASAWMSNEALLEDKDTATYVTEYEEKIKDMTVEEQIKAYDDYEAANDIWQKKCGEIYAANPNTEWDDVLKELGPCPWPGPMNCKNPYRPAGLYECMLDRVNPYSMKGFLFYQGESDDHKPTFYYKLFRRMIKQWRDDWKDESMPMLYVQLPGHRYKQDPDYKHWCLVREAQDEISKTIPNAKMAVTIDLGEFNEIHPKDKEEVGRRLYLQAMSSVYNKIPENEAEAPDLDVWESYGKELTLEFTNASNGLVAKSEPITGFEIAGADGEYYPADAKIVGSKVVLTSEKVANPVDARYLWTNYPETVDLYNSIGLPVRPFRTTKDCEKALSGGVEIRQIMTVDTK